MTTADSTPRPDAPLTPVAVDPTTTAPYTIHLLREQVQEATEKAATFAAALGLVQQEYANARRAWAEEREELTDRIATLEATRPEPAEADAEVLDLPPTPTPAGRSPRRRERPADAMAPAAEG